MRIPMPWRRYAINELCQTLHILPTPPGNRWRITQKHRAEELAVDKMFLNAKNRDKVKKKKRSSDWLCYSNVTNTFLVNTVNTARLEHGSVEQKKTILFSSCISDFQKKNDSSVCGGRAKASFSVGCHRVKRNHDVFSIHWYPCMSRQISLPMNVADALQKGFCFLNWTFIFSFEPTCNMWHGSVFFQIYFLKGTF